MKGDFIPKFQNGMTLSTLSAARKGSLDALKNTPTAPTLIVVLRYVVLCCVAFIFHDIDSVDVLCWNEMMMFQVVLMCTSILIILKSVHMLSVSCMYKLFVLLYLSFTPRLLSSPPASLAPSLPLRRAPSLGCYLLFLFPLFLIF